MNKPDVLSDEQLKASGKGRAEAPRDADAAYYEPLIQQTKEEMRLFMIEQHEIECALCKVGQEEKIGKTKAEVVREIFEEIERTALWHNKILHYNPDAWQALKNRKW